MEYAKEINEIAESVVNSIAAQAAEIRDRVDRSPKLYQKHMDKLGDAMDDIKTAYDRASLCDIYHI